MVYQLPSSFAGGMQGAVESLKKGVLPQAKPVPPPAPMITPEQKSFLPQKPKPVDPNKSPEVFKKKFIEKHGDGVAEDGRKYSQIPAAEIVVKVIRKYGDGVASDGTPYRDYLPKPASPNDPLEYRLSQIESLYGGPKSNLYTAGGVRGQTTGEKKFADKVTRVQKEGEIMKTIKAPYRGLESVGQNLAYGTAGVAADTVDMFGGDQLAEKIRKATEQEQFKSGLLSSNKGLIGGLQSGELSSVVETLSSGAGYLATAAKIPLYLMALTQGGNLSIEGEQQGQGNFGDKAIAYTAGGISAAIDRMSGTKVVDGLTRAGIKKETATNFVQRMNNYLKSLKPSDFEAGTEVIQQGIENIGRSTMGVDYDKGIQQYFEAGLLGKALGKVGDKGFSESPVTVLPPKAPKPIKVDNRNVETLKTIKVGKRANNNVIRNEERGFDPYTDIATHQEIVPSVDKTGLVRTTEQVQNLEDTLDPINDALTQSIKDEGVKISLDEFLIDSMNEAKQYENEGASYDRYVNQIKKDFEVYKRFTDEQGRIDLSKINEIKKAKYGISNFSDVESDKANKMVGKAAKELVEKYTTGESTQAINRELSRWYSARDLLLAMDGKTVKGGRLGKMAARVGGNIIGSYFGPLGSFAGGEISAAVQGQMMKGSLRKPSGTIDSESVLSKIPKRTTPQLPPASQSSVDKKVVLPMQSQPVSESVSRLPIAEATTKKDVSSKKVSLPIIQKTEVKAKLPMKETPKTPQVDGKTVDKIKAMQLEQEDMIRKGESVSDDFRTKWNDLQSQYKKEFIDSRIASERKKVDSSIQEIKAKVKENPDRADWGKKQIEMEEEGFNKLKKGDYFEKKYQEHISKIREEAKKSSLLKSVKKKQSLPLSQKSEVKYSKPIAPETLYHGTNTKFDKFDMSKVGTGMDNTNQTGGGIMGKGIYFTADEKTAGAYARDLVKYKGGKENIISVKPEGEFMTDIPKDFYDYFKSKFPKSSDISEVKHISGNKDIKSPMSFLQNLDDAQVAMREYAQEKGFIGLARKHKDGYSEYLVFDPKDITIKK